VAPRRLQERVPFRLSVLHRLAPTAPGVYVFWFRRYCIYVGKAERQFIRDRLLDHWHHSHNDNLRDWMTAKRDDILVAFEAIADPRQISRYERYYIRRFQPLANKVRYD